jgi:hypothetical protein
MSGGSGKRGSMITEKTRARAEALNPRERRRLRRNLIMWEGRLERAIDSLNYQREERALPKKDRMGEKSAATCDKYIKYAEEGVEECRAKLRKAKDEVNAALGTSL